MIRAFQAFSLLVLVQTFPFLATTNARGAELLMFDSKVCEWCDRWRAEIGPVYPKTEEGKIAPLRTIDIHQARPPAFKPIKGIVFTPTFVLWHDGREVGRILGYTGEDFFWGLLGELIEDMRAGRDAAPKSSSPGTAPVSGTPVLTERPPKQ